MATLDAAAMINQSEHIGEDGWQLPGEALLPGNKVFQLSTSLLKLYEGRDSLI
jgi:hypothetical protein